MNAIHEIADCFNTYAYGRAPLDLIEAFNILPNDNYSNYLRTLAVPFLIHLFEKHVTSEDDPKIWFSNSLNELKINIVDLIKENSSFIFLRSCFEQNVNLIFNNEVKSHAGEHYGNLFKEINHKSYFNEAKELLKNRLDRNNIIISNGSVLDMPFENKSFDIVFSNGVLHHTED